MTEIGEYAFAQYLTDSVGIIQRDENGPLYTNLDITIHGRSGSYAETYAAENGFAFEAVD